MNLFANKPESVKDVQLGNPPSVYEGYLYRFTDIDTNRVYVGVHKGYVGDGYWHSSQNTEFDKLLANPDANLKYEILEYGDYNQMTVSEHKILSEADAKNNPLYFNKTNGAPKYKPIDMDKVKDLLAKIEAGEFTCDAKESIEEVSKYFKLQVRFQEDAEHVREIADLIDDAGGSTKKCNPVIIAEKRQGGEDVIIDGNHTIAAVLKSKHGRDVPVARIPKDVHEDLTNEELFAIGDLMNRPSEIIKKRANKLDMVKFILTQYEKKVPVDDPSNKEFLKEMRCSNNQIKSILKEAKLEIEKGNLKKANQLWIDYTTGSGKKALETKKDTTKDKNTMCIALSSAMFKWDNIFNHIFTETEINKKTKTREKLKSKIVILVHHNGPSAEEKWKQDYQPDAIAKLKYFLNPIGYTFQIIEMPTTITNQLD
jgi:hypothetical protein